MKLRNQLIIGFGILLLAISLSSGLSVNEFGKVMNGFISYRNLTSHSNLVATHQMMIAESEDIAFNHRPNKRINI